MLNICLTFILIDMDENDINAKKIEIPNDNKQLKIDIKNNKEKYMSHIYDTFCKNFQSDKLPTKINFFKFKDTNLEVIVKQESYIRNLENLLDFYSDLEEYEKCKVIKTLIAKLNSENED